MATELRKTPKIRFKIRSALICQPIWDITLKTIQNENEAGEKQDKTRLTRANEVVRLVGGEMQVQVLLQVVGDAADVATELPVVAVAPEVLLEGQP